MDAKHFGHQGSLLLTHNQPTVAQTVLESGALLGGIGPEFSATMADALRNERRSADRKDRLAAPGAEPRDVLLWYAEAVRRGAHEPWVVQAAAAFAVNYWEDAVELNWHATVLGANADPAMLWASTIFAAISINRGEIAAYALGVLADARPDDPRLTALHSLVEQGLSESALSVLDDDSLRELARVFQDVGGVEGIAAVATALLNRDPSDMETREAYAGMLEDALLGAPGAPDLGSFHPTGAGRALLAISEAMTDDEDGRWQRRKLFAQLKGGESPEKMLAEMVANGTDFHALSDAFVFALVDALLYRSQRYEPARNLADYGVMRAAFDDPRLYRLHGYMTFLQGERLHGHASLLQARRIDPLAIELDDATRLRDMYFPDVNLFGDCFDADMTEPIGEALGHLLTGDFEKAQARALEGLTQARGRALPELELHLILGECHSRTGKMSPRSLKNFRRALDLLGDIRGGLSLPGDVGGADRLANAVAAKSLVVTEFAGLPGEALHVSQNLKLQSLADVLAGAAGIAPETAQEYVAGLGDAFQLDPPDVAPETLFAGLSEAPPSADAPWGEAWSAELAPTITEQRMAAREAAVTTPTWPKIAELNELVTHLAEGDIFLEYALFPDSAFVVVALPDDAEVVRVPLDKSLVQTARYAWACAAQPPADPENWSAEDIWPLQVLYSTLIAPIAHWLEGVQRIIVAPGGALQRVPFGALHDGETFLGDTFDILQVPNASMFAHSQLPTGGFQLQAAAVADPDGTWSSAAVAANALSMMFPNSQVVQGQSITGEQAMGLLGAAAIVHFSAPAFIDPDFPSASPMFLGKGVSEPECVLQPCTMFSFEAAPALVVADCMTSEPGRLGTDHEATHPGTAFHLGGAATVVATAWRGDATTTGLLFAEFYNQLRTFPVAAAMRKAQAKIRSNKATSHPYFWAAPICSGRGDLSIEALTAANVI